MSTINVNDVQVVSFQKDTTVMTSGGKYVALVGHKFGIPKGTRKLRFSPGGKVFCMVTGNSRTGGKNTFIEVMSVEEIRRSIESNLIIRIETIDDRGVPTVVLPFPGNNECYIDWGDGSEIEYITTSNPSHDYATGDIFDISIEGIVPKMDYRYNGTPTNLIGILNLGYMDWEDLTNAIYYCPNITDFILGNADTSTVNSTYAMFANWQNGTPPDIANLNTSSVTNIGYMFYYAPNMTGTPDVSNWDTSNITDMSVFMYNCTGLTTPPDVSNWNTSNTNNIRYIFADCTGLNTPPDVSNWDTSNITNISYAFSNLSSITTPPDVSNWNTSKVTTCENALSGLINSTTPPDVSNWNTSKMENMRWSLGWLKSSTTPPDVSRWDTSKVTTMYSMFSAYESITTIPDLSNFNTSNVTDMRWMMDRWLSIGEVDLPIDKWDISSLELAEDMLEDTTLTTECYNRTLIAWSKQTVKPNVTIHFGNSKYTPDGAAEAARNILIAKGWIITDGGPA